jgi:hypothetical protein
MNMVICFSIYKGLFGLREKWKGLNPLQVNIAESSLILLNSPTNSLGDGINQTIK